MPLKKGTTTIGAIYKGTTLIGKVYKGTTLVFSAYTFADWYETFVYNTIIPSTISSSTLKDGGIMKLKKIEGNGAIVNQNDNATNWNNDNPDKWSLSVDGRKYTLTATGDNTYRNALVKGMAYNMTTNHKYFWFWTVKSSKSMSVVLSLSNSTTLDSLTSVSANVLTKVGFLFSVSTIQSPTMYLNRNQGGINFVVGDTIEINDVQFIDLTLMFGAGNEPTTISDKRIQKILNSGYIAYNTGSYANSEVEEIEISKLPADYQEVEYIEATGSQYVNSSFNLTSQTNCVCDISFVITTDEQVNGIYGGSTDTRLQFGILNNNYWIGIGNKTYDLSISPDTNRHLFTIDLLNKKYGIDNNLTVDNTIVSTSVSKNIYLFAFLNGYTNTPYYYCKQKLYSCQIYDNNTLVRNFVPCYRKSDNVIGLYDLVNGVFYTNAGTGTFAKGNDVVSNAIILPNKVQLNGAINSHDTFEVSSSGYVFTKNIGSVDLGTVGYANTSYGIYSSSFSTVYNAKKPLDNNTMPNIICANFITSYRASSLYNSNTSNCITIDRDGDLDISLNTSGTPVAQLLSGVMLYYELATPQTITIPKKHLGSVDLGSLDWYYNSNGWFYTSISDGYSGNTDNLYCSKYVTLHYESGFGTNDNVIKWLSKDAVLIKDTSAGTDPTAFKNAMQGVILFYETNSEVANPILSKTFNVGGSITTDSDVLPNLTMGVQVL